MAQYRLRRPVELALKQAEQALTAYKTEECQIRTSNHEFNGWLDRSYADIHMMITDSQGFYPVRGSAVVQHGIRPGWNSDIMGALMDFPPGRARRAELLGGDASDGNYLRARRRTWKDFARDAPRRDGQLG